ncbi:MAG: acyl-CoA dehydrogenase family protein [Acidimicrobiales bacterium]
MDLRYSEAEEEFRAGLRAWLAETIPNLPPKPVVEAWPERRVYDTGWQRRLYDAGYAGIDWPSEFGGRGASPVEQLIYLEELERFHAPYVGVNFVGLLHAGPTIAVEGTPEQRNRFLPGILKGESIWCQGFSEPNAGSDLASLRTRATRDGDEYVIRGQKIWTSHAEVADYCELLVRTGPDGSGHRGITWLAMPMDAPGIDVRPLRTIAGSSEFAELFLDDVRVPVDNRLGEENDGWRVTMVTLSFERGTAFVSELFESIELLRTIRDAAARSGMLADTEFCRRVGRLGAELDALWALVRRNISEAGRGTVPGVGASVFKLSISELRQRLGDLGMSLLDSAGMVWDDVPGPWSEGGAGGGVGADGGGADGGGAGAGGAGGSDAGTIDSSELVHTWVHSLSRTIAAGTSQIQRNIIAERILGLPKEPRP